MKSMAISAFKTHALQAIASVADDHESITITKHGKPLAQVIPFKSTGNKPVAGKLAASLVYEKDIETPIGTSLWEAAQ